MKYRYLDLSELAYSHQSLLPAILAALPIPEDYEHIEKIEHLLKPVPEDPNERKSIEQIQKEFGKKIDKLIKIHVDRHRHHQELGNYRFQELKKKQDKAFRNLKIYGTTGSVVINSSTLTGSVVQSLEHGTSCVTFEPVVSLKPRNWFAKQIVSLLFDTKVR